MMSFYQELDELVKTYTTTNQPPHEEQIFSSELELLCEESGFIAAVSETWTADPKMKLIGFYHFPHARLSDLQKRVNEFLATVSPELPSEIHDWSIHGSSAICRFAVYSDSDRKFITGRLYFAGI